MIGPTVDELTARVRRRLSEGDADFFTEEMMLTLLSDGQDVIATDCPWTCVASFATQTVANQSRYLLPADVIRPVGAYLVNSAGRVERLNYTEPDVIDGMPSYAAAPRSNRACTYRRSDAGTELVLYPAPSTTGLWIEVRAHVRPRKLTATTSRTDMDPIVTHCLVNYALWQIKGKDEEVGQSDRYRQDFEESLRDLEAKQIITQFDQFNRTRGRRAISRTLYGRP